MNITRVLSVMLCGLAGTLTCAAAESAALDHAVAVLQSGNAAGAETLMREAVQQQPKDAEALGLLAVVLDQQRKYDEAEPLYRQAIAIEPRSVRLHNNYGNHLLKSNHVKQAELEFRKALEGDPGNVNARTQLAALYVTAKRGTEALAQLNALPAPLLSRPDLMLLSLQAEYLAGHRSKAETVLARLSVNAAQDATASIALGSALFAAEQYAQAEKVFSQALERVPDSFEATYYCGLAASRSGHEERARDLLQRSLALQPQNIDAMYDLAVVEAKSGDYGTALQILGRAAHSGAQASVERLLAELTARLGYFEDSAAAWDRYLQLAPSDVAAQRERAFVQTASAARAATGLAALTTYVQKHPEDAVGHYELATAESPTEPEAALNELSRAIQMKPDLTAARFARGLLLSREGHAQAALIDFESAARTGPKDAIILDRLGEAETATGHLGQGLQTLRSAAALAPDNPTVLNHLARALVKSGNEEEARPIFERIRSLGPAKPEPLYNAGLLQFIGLSPDEQLRQYRSGVERTVKANPSNVQAQLRYLQLLIDDGNTEQAASVTRTIASLHPAAALAQETQNILLSANQVDAANQFRAELSRSH